ncbi:MAG: TasA family protein [Haloarculaceae archaeon]
MKQNIKLTRRRVLGGLVTVGAASAAAGAGTMAYFSDTESSSGNTITAGTLDLTSPADGVIDVTNAVPGDSIPASGTTTIQATYDSASTIDPAEIDLGTSISEPGGEPTEPSNSTNQTASAFAQQLNVDTANVTVNGSGVNDLTSTQSVSTAADLDGLALDAVANVSPGDTVGLELEFTFDSNAGNDYQADGVAIDVSFTAQQPSAD